MWFVHNSQIWYILGVLEDLVFRSLWTLTFSVGEGGSRALNNNVLKTVLAVMEVFRRFVWNFFRLENEHLNNCGQFRVVRDISVHPLDPSELHDDDEELGQSSMTRMIRNFTRRASVIFTSGREGTNGNPGDLRRRRTISMTEPKWIPRSESLNLQSIIPGMVSPQPLFLPTNHSNAEHS